MKEMLRQHWPRLEPHLRPTPCGGLLHPLGKGIKLRHMVRVRRVKHPVQPSELVVEASGVDLQLIHFRYSKRSTAKRTSTMLNCSFCCWLRFMRRCLIDCASASGCGLVTRSPPGTGERPSPRRRGSRSDRSLPACTSVDGGTPGVPRARPQDQHAVDR